MAERVLTWLAGLVVAVISASGYFGVVLLMAIESACIPLPSELIMPFAGYLVFSGGHTLTGPFTLIGAATAGALGCNLGSVIAYEIGCYGGRPLVEKYGRYIWLSGRELQLAERFFDRFGAAAVFLGRLLPVIRTFIALPAGLARMSRLGFHLYTFVGSWLWCFGLAWIGMKLGERWASDPRLRSWLHRLDALIIVALLAGLVLFARSHWKNRLQTQG